MSRESLDSIKPAVVIWTTPKNVLDMKNGYYPSTFYFSNPNVDNKSFDYVEVIIPFDVFEIIWQEKKNLDSAASDLNF